MFESKDLERVCKNIASKIEEELSRVGLIFRIFHRVKSDISLTKKIILKGEGYYDGEQKYLRDIIGIRIIFYFSDDLPVVNTRLKTLFTLVEETIDNNEETKFAPTRENLIFRLPNDLIKEFREVSSNKLFDTTFEVQLRTILSEGWHEIDHDLRYKCLRDWDDHGDLARNFNGILASLETSEYSILRLFEQLSYRHYKSREIAAMVRTKFRLRFNNDNLSKDLIEHLKDEILRDIFKMDRIEVLNFLFESKLIIPLNIENMIYLSNYFFIKDKYILDKTPPALLHEFGLAL